MSPLSLAGNKRPRSEADIHNNNEEIVELITHNDTAVDSMSDRLDAIESCSDPSQVGALVTQASTTLLALKSIQRDVMEKLKKTGNALQEKRTELEQQAMRLESLDYEKAYLENKLSAQVSTPHLERMCREETQTMDNSSGLSKEQVMNAFLCGNVDVSYDDPANYQTVLTKLHQEINLRGSLERDSIQAQKALTEKTKSLEQSQQFLSEFPRKLQQVERASLPLQKFFQGHPPPSETATLSPLRIGTERSQRLKLARSLSGNLYTLFLQLQSYVDKTAATATSSTTEPGALSVHVSPYKPNNHNRTKAITAAGTTEMESWFQPDPSAVQLCLPLVLDKDKKNKHVTIEFVYLPRLGVVTAQASGCADSVDLPSLLMNVFPGDDGTMVWSADSVHLKDAASSTMPGRPYHWCNYLAGIHLPAASLSALDPSLDPISTMAIVKTLLRRLDANATLTHILSTLKKRPTSIPAHPAWSDPSDCSSAPVATKLIGWTEEQIQDASQKYCKDGHHVTKTFAATLKRKASKLKATVMVDMSRYPSVPPRWALTTGKESWGQDYGTVASLQEGTNPLYDNTLGQIERAVNSQPTELVKKDVEETYNWILAHQLERLIRLWDDYQRACESGAAAGQVPRSIKGKDRLPG